MALIIKDVTKSFGEPPQLILKGISEEIKDGEMVSITGRSGSGKSTLLYIMSSLDRPTAGTVEIDGVQISKMNSVELHHFRNMKMGFVFQFHYLLPELTALENVLMPAMKSKVHAEKIVFAIELLRQFEIENKADSFPSQLSGGEQQRVAIARALIMKPRYLFADEPTGNLDSVNGANVMAIFKRINQENGTTILYVTHDQEFASLASRKINMVDGRITK